MKTKIYLLFFLLLVINIKGYSTIWTIINSGTAFSPPTITITFGDTLNFVLESSHNASEVSFATWSIDDNTPLSGGFETPYGGGMVFPGQLSVGTHYYVCTPHASVGMKGSITVQSCNIPIQPGAISGNTNVCSGNSNIYSISAVAGATSYTWTLPGGWTGTSVSNSISATASAVSGDITVTANNVCGSSLPKTLTITANSIPSQAGSISGNLSVCSGTSNSYSISSVSGASSYTWVLPGSWSGTSTTNSITAIAGTLTGNISVTANNSCGSSVAQLINVSVSTSIPAQPDTLSGNKNVCAASLNTYSITSVAGASSYTWTLPVGWIGTSTLNSIGITVGSSTGDITVTANNACGSSLPQTLTIIIGGGSAPSQPGTIGGNASVCSGTFNSYSVAMVSGVDSYTWTLPGGWVGVSATNSINVTSGSSGGIISVSANNACGSSLPQILNVSSTLIDTSVTVSVVTLMSNAVGAVYQWLDCINSIPITGQTSQSFSPSANGTYAVIVTQNTCSDTSSCFLITDVGINENNAPSSVNVFPNPSEGKFIIESDRIRNGIIEIYNILGEKIYQTILTNSKSEIDFKNHPKGIYFVKIYNGNTIFSNRIVIH